MLKRLRWLGGISKRPPQGKPYIEVQIHPGNIRRGVRYVFLDARRLWTGGAILGVYVLLVVISLVLAPKVVSDLFNERDYRGQVERRGRLGERLRSLTGELSEVGGGTEALRLTMNRVYLAYGLGSGEAVGQGGYPFSQAPVPDSIYADAIRQAGRLESQLKEQLQVIDTFIGEVQAFESAHDDQVHTTPSVSPLTGEFVLTSPFGRRRSPFTKEMHFHSGLDLAAAIGTPILAPADGTVVFAGRYPLKLSVPWWRYGNLVALRNGDRFITLFGHCDEIRVKSGEQVRQGDWIATVGNTGWSTSPHLHYEVRRPDPEGTFKPVDPRIYILDHRWRDQERLLVRARSAPDASDFEPLPRLIGH